jgi:hypothetical protein
MKKQSADVDVDSESHHNSILDEEGHILFKPKVPHKINEFTKNIKHFTNLFIFYRDHIFYS